MTEKVYDFNELDPKFWMVWTGPGHFNLFEVSEGKFKFETMYFYTYTQNYIVLRTSRPYSFVNNAFSIDFEVTEDSYGEIAFAFSPLQADTGFPQHFMSIDVVSVLLNSVTSASFVRRLDGETQVYYYKDLEKRIRSGTIKYENKQGMVAFYVNDELITVLPQQFRAGHVYIVIRGLMDSGFNNRRIKGWIDNFRIQDYQLACINPELAAILPALSNMTTATLSLTFLLTIVGMLKGVLR